MSPQFSGDRLKAVLEEKKITQKALAKRLGRGIVTVWRWCNGESVPGSDDLFAICFILACKADELADD
jgi:transcriptional regulator with XRE-family HTH domain